MADSSSTASVRVPSKRNDRRRLRRGEWCIRIEGDSVSSMPDAILQHILSFIRTKFAIRTSLLSKRWKRVWRDTPCLDFPFDTVKLNTASMDKILKLYTAAKVMNFHLCTSMEDNVPHIGRWIGFTMSRNVENLSLELFIDNYDLPDSFYVNSSVKQLTVELLNVDMIPRCSVSWSSLKMLCLRCRSISDESIAKILSGCPILENLTLCFRGGLNVLDLSESLRLRALEIQSDDTIPGGSVSWTSLKMLSLHCRRISGEYMAKIISCCPILECLTLCFSDGLNVLDLLESPRLRTLEVERSNSVQGIHCLNYKSTCTIADVSSLTEAKVDINFKSTEHLLEKLQNVEKLTFGVTFFRFYLVPRMVVFLFRCSKLKALTLKTSFPNYVIPGIKRMMQNSPDLQKLTILQERHGDVKQDWYLNSYMGLRGFYSDESWNPKMVSVGASPIRM